MKYISKLGYRISKGWVVLLSLVILIFFIVLILPGQQRIADRYSNSMGSPDTKFTYSGNSLYQLAGVYGIEGRAAYIRARWTFDLVFPPIYTFFLLTATSWFLNKITIPGSRWRLLNLVPLITLVFDFLENAMTTGVMAKYPVHFWVGENLSPIFTTLKWMVLGASIVFLLIALFIYMIRNMKRNRGTRNVIGR